MGLSLVLSAFSLPQFRLPKDDFQIVIFPFPYEVCVYLNITEKEEKKYICSV